jgi:hypothetical protein
MSNWDGDAFDAHLDNYGDPDIEPCDHPPEHRHNRRGVDYTCYRCPAKPDVPPDMEPEPCDHPHDQISYRGKYAAECQQCGSPVVTPDPDELWADMEMTDVRWPYPLWTYQSRGELETGTRIFLPRIGLVHGE